jgi:type IV secretion system protein VirD4
MLCDEVGKLGRIDTTADDSHVDALIGTTLRTFWQNAAQLQIYGPQANTLVDNAGVIQVFGPRNRRMAQESANLIGGISADEIMNMKSGEQMLLVKVKVVRCKQARYYNDKMFANCEKS